MAVTAFLLLSIVVAADASGYQEYLERYEGNRSNQPQTGGAAGAGYQRYAGDYAPQGHSGSSYAGNRSNQGASYQQYLERYAGGYSTQEHSGSDYAGNHSNIPQSRGAAGVDYHQYLDRYAGSYAAHGQIGGGHTNNHSGQPESNGASGANYQQYLDRYAGDYASHGASSYASQPRSGAAAGSQGAGFEQYLDRYAGGYAGRARGHVNGTQGGNYQRYLNQYAGNQSSQGVGGSSGDYQHYLETYAGDYTGVAGGAGNHSSQIRSAGAQGGHHQKYLERYAADFAGYLGGSGAGGSYQADEWMPRVHNVSDLGEWRDAAMRMYAGPDSQNQSYEDLTSRYAGSYADRRELRNAPKNASACHTLRALNEWRRAEDSRIRAYVPKAYQSFPERALNHTYSENAARIRREEQALARNNSNRTLGADEQARGAPAETAQPSTSSQHSSQGTGPRVPNSSAASNHTPPEAAQSRQRSAEAPAGNSSAGATAFLALSASDEPLPRTGGTSTLNCFLASLALVGVVAAVAMKQRQRSVSVDNSLSTRLVPDNNV